MAVLESFSDFFQYDGLKFDLGFGKKLVFLIFLQTKLSKNVVTRIRDSYLTDLS